MTTAPTTTTDDDALLLAIATTVAAVALGLLAAIAAAAFSGALAPQVFGPGPAVRYGLVLTRTIGDLAAAVTVGVLVLAAVALPVRKQDDARRPLAHRPALVLAASGATVWALAELVLLILTYLDISGQSVSDPDFGAQLVAFARDLDTGRLLAVTCVAAAVIGLLAAGATRLRSAGLLALAAIATLTPAALGGHASISVGHETAVTALGLHLLGVCVWVGGLTGLLLLSPGLHGPASAIAARRYSAVAGWCYVAVAVSGVISAWLRIPSIGDLGSRYGLIVVAKTLALLALGVAGWVHRTRTLDQLDGGRPHAFARLAAAEVALMVVTTGLAVALSQSAPPASDTGLVDPVTDLTGYPMPGAPTLSRWLFSWQPDLMWVLICLVLAGLYLAGMRRLRARGDHWPAHRAVLWILGLLVVLYATSGGPAVYGRVTFSGHMIGHMLIAMVAPVPMVLAAPVTLALRTLRARDDGTRGPREWLLTAIGSPVARWLSFPPAAAVLFAFSLVIFYYSPLFEISLRTHVGHELMHVHFLLTGYLFAWVLVGLDPGPRRWSYPLRLVLLLATMGFHAFFGIALLQGETVLAQDWFAQLAHPWGRNLLLDQQLGGGYAWGFGEFPTFVLAVLLAVQWSRESDREAVRVDRAADRDGDAELKAYNAMLAQLAERDRR